MPVTRDDVIWSFKLFLGRDPGSESVIEQHMKYENIDALRQAFIRSPEFTKKMSSSAVPQKSVFVAHSAAGLEIDAEGSDDEIRLCIEKIRAAWTHLGLTKPHYSVLTNEKYLPENLDVSLKEFWVSGENGASHLESILTRHGCDSLATKTCLEYGCGVGRITIPLSRRFARVHGYDISHAHLSLAQKHAEAESIDNVSFHLCSETLLEPLEKCDVFYSIIVFQHNPPPLISRLIRNALRALKPGGIAVFQVPTYRAGYRFKTVEWLNTDHPLKGQMHCLPQQHIFSIAAEESTEMLEVWEDYSGAPALMISNIFVIRKSAVKA